jgi:large subunit ribosomal protein L4
MELAVYNISGKEAGRKVSLNDNIFGIEPNDHAIYLDVKLIQANKRQGTHSSKERSQLSGSTRKLKRQKGTGTARMGDIKSPILRGGARAFGPHPRSYSFKLNKKLRKLARISALSHKAKANEILVVEDFNFEAPKTKQYLEMLNNFELNGRRTLLVLPDIKENVYLSSRNIQGAKVVSADSINTYDVLNAYRLIIAEGSFSELDKLFNK